MFNSEKRRDRLAREGGPAFARPICPATEYGASGDGHPGMSLRDYFAGQALAGLLARQDFMLFMPSGEDMNDMLAAANAYHLADAMLAARGAE